MCKYFVDDNGRETVEEQARAPLHHGLLSGIRRDMPWPNIYSTHGT